MVGLASIVLLAFVAVLLRLAIDIVSGHSSRGYWPFLAAAVAAGATLVGAFFTREQQARAEERFRLDTAVSGLKLLTAGDGQEYARQGVVAGALATLLHLGHPVIAMRVLAACWEDNAVDVPSATWLISEIFVSDAVRRPHSNAAAQRAQTEAAALLDVHARELCHETPGRFFWPSAISDEWIPEAPLSARLRALRAVISTLTSKEPAWWNQGGRLGWGAAVLHLVLNTDEDESVRAHAAHAVAIILPMLERAQLADIQTANAWLKLSDIKEAARNATPIDRPIVMLSKSFQQLEAWASGTRWPAAEPH